MLSSAHPGTTFGDTQVYTLSYGQQGPKGRYRTGGPRPDRGRRYAVVIHDRRPGGQRYGCGCGGARPDGPRPHIGRSGDYESPFHPGQLVRESSKVGIPVPSFAGLGTSEDEQRQMSRRLKGICAKLKKSGSLAGHGNAGLASNFIDLAHAKTKPGGVIALVLPAACVSGSSWEDARRLLEREYEDLAVLTIAAHGQTDRAFSADTGMAEALVVATKRCAGGKRRGEALFVNLYFRPRSLSEAFEMARAVDRLSPQARHGRICVGNRETVGTYIRAPLTQGGCASIRETTLAAAAIGLAEGRLELPQGYSTPLPFDSAQGSWNGGVIPHRHLWEPKRRDPAGAV